MGVNHKKICPKCATRNNKGKTHCPKCNWRMVRWSEKIEAEIRKKLRL